MGITISDPLNLPGRPPVRDEVPPLRVRRLLDDATTLPAGADDRRVAIALEVLSALLEWRSRGGEIRFESGAAARFTDTARTPPRAPGAGDPVAVLQAILDGIVFSSDDEVEVLRLHAAIRESERWCRLPRELQRAVVALTVARLRRLQDDRRLIHPRLEECFSMLTAFSKREQPGYVVGLSRHHVPVRGSWQEDAEAWWERLRAMANPAAATPGGVDRLHAAVVTAVAALADAAGDQRGPAEDAIRRAVLDAVANGVSPRDPKLVKVLQPVVQLLDVAELKAVRAAVRGEPDEEAEEEPEDPGEDWAAWSHTRGRRAVIVGGEDKPIARSRLQRSFGFSELEWLPVDPQKTALNGLRERIWAGRVDLVLVLSRFVGPEADEILVPACKERGVDITHVDRGYSVGRVRLAIEKLLTPAS